MEEVGPIHEDNLAMYEKICSSLVQIVCYKPPTSQPERHVKHVLTGIIVTSGDDFCHIIALWNAVLCDKKSSAWLFEVIFPDGTRVDLPRPRKDVDIRGNLAAFSLPTSARVNPVEFSQQKVSRNEKVFAVGFQAPPSMPSHISCGLVTNARDGFFSHDCPPFPETRDGDPVFNKLGEFVGISCKDRGITIALSINFITRLLAMFHDDMMGKPLSEILQCIKDKAKPRKKN